MHNLVTPTYTITRSLPADKSTLNFYGLAIIFEEIVIFIIHTLLDLWTSEFDDLGVQTFCCTNDRQCWFALRMELSELSEIHDK